MTRLILTNYRAYWGAFMYFMINVSFANALYPFDTPQKEAQFSSLLKELRCLVCQNQDLSDSNAPLAKDLKHEVYMLVNDNKTDGEIIQFLTARYGDFILFKPPLKSITILLWVAPLVFLLLGLWIFTITCFKWRHHE